MKIKDIELGKEYAVNSNQDWQRYTGSGRRIIPLEAGWDSTQGFSWGETPMRRAKGRKLLTLMQDYGIDTDRATMEEAALYTGDMATAHYAWQRANRFKDHGPASPFPVPQGWRLEVVNPQQVRCTWEEYQQVIEESNERARREEQERREANDERAAQEYSISSTLAEYGAHGWISGGKVTFTAHEFLQLVSAVQDAAFESMGEPE